MDKVLMVAIGGGIGAAARFLVSGWAAERFGGSFPYGTLIVNVAGCLIIGVVMGLVTERIIVNPYWRLLLTTGFLGGLTTFSSFGYETLKLAEDGAFGLAAWNILLNVMPGLMATWVGIALSKMV